LNFLTPQAPQITFKLRASPEKALKKRETNPLTYDCVHSHRELSPEHDRVLSAATKERKSAGVKITRSQKRCQISGYTLQKNSKAINFGTRSNHFSRHRKLTLAFFSRAAT
jgi:hypothetical protein